MTAIISQIFAIVLASCTTAFLWASNLPLLGQYGLEALAGALASLLFFCQYQHLGRYLPACLLAGATTTCLCRWGVESLLSSMTLLDLSQQDPPVVPLVVTVLGVPLSGVFVFCGLHRWIDWNHSEDETEDDDEYSIPNVLSFSGWILCIVSTALVSAVVTKETNNSCTLCFGLLALASLLGAFLISIPYPNPQRTAYRVAVPFACLTTLWLFAKAPAHNELALLRNLFLGPVLGIVLWNGLYQPPPTEEEPLHHPYAALHHDEEDNPKLEECIEDEEAQQDLHERQHHDYAALEMEEGSNDDEEAGTTLIFLEDNNASEPETGLFDTDTLAWLSSGIDADESVPRLREDEEATITPILMQEPPDEDDYYKDYELVLQDWDDE